METKDPKNLAELLPAELNQHRTAQTPVNSDVLTPDETAEVLRQAALKKEAEIRKKNYWNKVSTPISKKDWLTPEQIIENMVDDCAEDGIPFVIDEENARVIELLSLYFAGDSRFEAADIDYDLSKGIYLFGGVGVGKTHLMRLFRSSQRKPFRIVDCSDISAEYKKEGEDGISKYFHDITVHERNHWGHEKIGWCFDDLGMENNSKFFGNEANVMERIIERRYRSERPLITHIISNLTTAEIESRYGSRIKDRLREMMNVIVCTGTKSRRK